MQDDNLHTDEGKSNKRILESEVTKMATIKNTKQELINILKNTKVKDKNLMERIKYALNMATKDLTKVTKQDLLDLVNELPAPVETSPKPAVKKLSKKKADEPKVEEVEDEPEETEEVVEEQPEEKVEKPKKKVAKKNEAVQVVVPHVTKGNDSIPMAKMFPAEIDHKDLGKLIAVPDKYHTYKEIVKALEEGKTLYIAAYWTKRHIQKFQYSEFYMVNAPKNGFPDDLDILVAVLPCETIERLYAMSSYTEALFRFEGVDFMPIEDTDPVDGSNFKVRISAGMEFEIYEPAEENEEEK